MSLELTLAAAVAILALVAVLALSARNSGEWQAFYLEIAGLALFVLFLNRLFGFPVPATELTAKGKSGDFILAAALFFCMLLGMVSQYLYRRFEKPKRRRTKFDWGVFIAPVFASPIVFIPLLAAFQNADVDLANLTVPRLMIFFVAYQNGFFWKEFFDRKQREESEKKP